MTARHFLTIAAIFCSGYFLAVFTAREKPTAHRDLSSGLDVSAISVQNCANPGVDSYDYRAYKVVANNVSVLTAAPPEGTADVWRISFDSGRTIVFATRKPLD